MVNDTLHIVIVAAGKGSRFGSSLPKQFCLLDGQPVLMHAIDRLRTFCPNARLTVVLSAEMEQYWLDLCREYHFDSPCIVHGGATRWESVKNAIEHDGATADGLTIVHDGARPLVQADVTQRLIEIMADDKVDGAVTVVPVTDSLRRFDENGRLKAVDRAEFRAVQTPQIFRTERLLKAYSLPYKTSFTDDASVMEDAGFQNIESVEGSVMTMKITNPRDLEIAALYLR